MVVVDPPCSTQKHSAGRRTGRSRTFASRTGSRHAPTDEAEIAPVNPSGYGPFIDTRTGEVGSEACSGLETIHTMVVVGREVIRAVHTEARMHQRRCVDKNGPVISPRTSECGGGASHSKGGRRTGAGVGTASTSGPRAPSAHHRAEQQVSSTKRSRNDRTRRTTIPATISISSSRAVSAHAISRRSGQ